MLFLHWWVEPLRRVVETLRLCCQACYSRWRTEHLQASSNGLRWGDTRVLDALVHRPVSCTVWGTPVLIYRMCAHNMDPAWVRPCCAVTALVYVCLLERQRTDSVSSLACWGRCECSDRGRMDTRQQYLWCAWLCARRLIFSIRLLTLLDE